MPLESEHCPPSRPKVLSFSSIVYLCICVFVYLYLSFAEVSECPRRASTALEFLKHRRRRSSCRLAQSRRRGGAGKAVRVPKVSGKRLLFKIIKDDQQGIIVTFSFQGLHQEGRQVEAPPQPTPSALRARCPLTGLTFTFTFRAKKFQQQNLFQVKEETTDRLVRS